MRVLDENDNELVLEDLNLEEGELVVEQILKEHHEGSERQEPIRHYAVSCFYFQDGSMLEIEDENDPRVKVIDRDNGIFEYNGEKEVRGVDLRYVEDQPEVEAVAEWDEFEDIQRWKPFPAEQIQANKDAQQLKEQQEAFLNQGMEMMAQLQSTIEELNAQLTAYQETLATTTQVESENATIALAELVNQ